MDSSEFKEFRKKHGLSQEEVAEIAGVKTGTVSKWEQGVRNMTKSTSKLLKAYIENKHNVPVQDVVANEPLEVFKTKAGTLIEELKDGTFKMTVPFVPVQAQASYVSQQIDHEHLEYKKQTFRVAHKGQGRYLAWQIKNDSMDDGTNYGIKDGDIKLTRQLGRHLWRGKFKYNNFPFWIIVTNDDVICKEIIDHDVDNGIITCHSLNSTYKDFDLHLDDVRELYNVIPTLDD